MNRYQYLYSAVLHAIRKVRESDIDEWTAVFILSFVMYANILNVFIVPVVLFGPKVMITVDRLEVTVVFTLILLAHYFMFIHKSRWKDLLNTFDQESKERRQRMNRWVVAYVAGSPVLFIVLNFAEVLIWFGSR